ncbi:helix-turn-helix domain-containing protein [Leptolyngbya ohadii]|uniref:helix-turn-helix domain-containing protein n=1 Tax=Leptolyngbya ohadii TaxID=1962290 RepID=UPI000B59A113|nr:helix-turn-helix domain-containing protein [Leptolyngbya ohadii]
MNKERFSTLISILRQRLDLSQERLAAQLGVSFQTINRWENQRVSPSPNAVRLIKQRLIQMGAEGEDLLAKYFWDETR